MSDDSIILPTEMWHSISLELVNDGCFDDLVSLAKCCSQLHKLMWQNCFHTGIRYYAWVYSKYGKRDEFNKTISDFYGVPISHMWEDMTNVPNIRNNLIYSINVVVLKLRRLSM